MYCCGFQFFVLLFHCINLFFPKILILYYAVIGWKNASMPDGSINRAMTFKLEERSRAHTFRVGCLKGNIEFAVFNVGPESKL